MAIQPFTKKTFLNEDQRWVAPGGIADLASADTVILDRSLFDLVTAFPNGMIPSGVVLGKVTATGLYGPYGGTSDEVQTLTVGGAGLTSFTVTFGGQTTGSIAAAATSAIVQTALEALPTIGVGNIGVSGGAGGPWTLTFKGTLADTNVAQVTTTPTGGSGTVTPATSTAGGVAGGSGGLETPVGFLAVTVPMVAGQASTADEFGALYWRGEIDESYLPANSGLDIPGKATLATKFRFV